MADRFSSFSELVHEMVLDRDFRISSIERPDSTFLVLAPHGGKIERGTSELTRAIARNDLSFYVFEGIRPAQNKDLHITSHRFDEPTALKLAERCAKVIGIHGRKNREDSKTTYLGGLDEQLTKSIERELSKGGFFADSTNREFPAENPNNICNRGSTSSGVQLELPLALRNELLASNEHMVRYASAVRAALFN